MAFRRERKTQESEIQGEARTPPKAAERVPTAAELRFTGSDQRLGDVAQHSEELLRGVAPGERSRAK